MIVQDDVSSQKKMWQGNVQNRFHEKRAEITWSVYESNFEKLKTELIKPLSENKVVLEIGCHMGRWTRELYLSKKIIGVDLYNESGEYIKKEFPELKNFEFYVTLNNTLSFVDNGSIDFIFSIDALTRASKKTIESYIKEIARIISSDGICLLHLPCNCSSISNYLGFTNIEKSEILNICMEFGFNKIEFDTQYITHGILLKLSKNG